MGGAPYDVRVLLTRTIALGGSLAAGWGGFLLFLQYGAADGLDAMDIVRAGLIFASTFWLAWGALQALAGLTTQAPKRAWVASKIETKTAILVPVYNEDPVKTFARIAAMEMSLQATGQAAQFHFAVLSDTRNEDVAAQEATWFRHLVQESAGQGRMFYRRRQSNKGRKAGNIEDFVKRSGAAYDFCVILDADSLMEGETLVEMVRRMQSEPRLGLLQTLPVVTRAQSRFGRAMQFAGSFYSPIFARGLAMMQGQTGPFWGHNAIVRTRAFAESCGLPELSGRAPFGGHVLSHDYVEAALLARAGWIVRLDDDLGGSFEEAPENMVDHAKRDRRWCQGNLQHSKIMLAPGLKGWNRFVFLQGILSYVAPVFWLAFIVASIIAPLFVPPVDYFPLDYWPFPVLPINQASKALGLAVGVVGLLFLPKILILLDAVLRGRARGFGGMIRATQSTLSELMFSSLIAPVFLMFQTRSVFQVVLGFDGGWPSQSRGDGGLTLKESFLASHWMITAGALGIGATQVLAPDLVLWLLPVTLPMVFAPLIICLSSRPGRPSSFLTPQDMAEPTILRQHHLILSRWQGMEAPIENREMPGLTVSYA